jgi:hypothetical protein
VFGKITGIALALDPVAQGKGDEPGALLILNATDAASAKVLEEEVLPKLLGLFGPQAPRPSQQTIQGQRISAVPFPPLGPDKQLHVGRHEKMLVFGLEAGRVADALAAGAKKGGLLAGPKAAAALKGTDSATVLGVLSLGHLLPVVLPKESVDPRAKIAGGPGIAPSAGPQQRGGDPITAKLAKELTRATEALPPAILTLERQPDQLTLMLRQPGLRGVAAKIINLIVESGLERTVPLGGPVGIGGNAVPVQVVPPPPPKS